MRRDNDSYTASRAFLDQVLERLDIDRTAPESQLVSRWESIVGSHIASHCMCDGLKNGILYVVCVHPANAGIVRLNKGEILKKVNSAFPELNIEKINIRLET